MAPGLWLWVRPCRSTSGILNFPFRNSGYYGVPGLVVVYFFPQMPALISEEAYQAGQRERYQLGCLAAIGCRHTRNTYANTYTRILTRPTNMPEAIMQILDRHHCTMLMTFINYVVAKPYHSFIHHPMLYKHHYIIRSVLVKL